MDEGRFDGEALAESEVGTSTRSGARTGFVAQTLIQLGSLGATMIMARLLTKEDFGLIAGVQSIMGASSLLGLAGAGATLVTRKAEVDRAASSYVWLLGSMGMLFATAIALAAGPITAVLGLPEARNYLVVLALTLPLSFIAMIPEALLLRLRRFGAHRSVALANSFTYFAVEIALVLNGWGVWSVIIGQIAGGTVGMVTAFILAKWIPTHLPSWRLIREDLGNLSGLGLNQLFTYLHKNLDYWTVSRVLGPAALGSYYVAFVLPNIVRLRLSDMFRQVMLPILSSPTGLKDPRVAYLDAYRIFLFVSVPALVGILALAGPIVNIFFGGGWNAAVGPMRIILLATIVDLMVQATATLAIARRTVRNVAWTSVVRVALLLLMLLILVPTFQNTLAAASAVLVATVGSFIFQELRVAAPLGVGGGVHLKALAHAAIPSTAMGLVVYALTDYWLVGRDAVALLIGVPTGAVVFVCASLVFSRGPLADTVRQMKLVLAPRIKLG